MQQYNIHNHPVSLRAFMAWFMASSFTCFQFCTQVILGPMAVELMQAFSLDAVSVSYVVSSFFYVYLLMQLPAGILLDRYPAKYIMPITCSICAIGAVLMGLASTVYLFVFARMLCGFGSAFGFIGTMRVLRNYFSLKYMALFIGFTEMMGFILTAVCEQAVSFYLPVYGYKSVLFYFGLIGLAIAIFMYISSLSRFAPEHEFAPPRKHDIKVIAHDFKELVTDKQMLILGVISFSFFALVTSYAALWGVPSLVNINQLSFEDATQAMSYIFLGIATGGPLAGVLTTKLRDLNKLIFWSGLINAGLFLILLYSNLDVIIINMLLYLTGVFGCCYLLCFTIANNLVAARLSGTCMGLINMITMTSALVLQPIMGYLVALDGQAGMLNGAPVYLVSGYKRACWVLIVLFLFASFLSTRLKSSSNRS